MRLIMLLLDVYQIIMIVRVVLSWVPHNRYHPVVQFIYNITEPVLRPVRQVIPPISGIDFSPMIVLVAIHVLARYL